MGSFYQTLSYSKSQVMQLLSICMYNKVGFFFNLSKLNLRFVILKAFFFFLIMFI